MENMNYKIDEVDDTHRSVSQPSLFHGATPIVSRISTMTFSAMALTVYRYRQKQYKEIGHCCNRT